MDNVIPGLYASVPEPLRFGPSLEICPGSPPRVNHITSSSKRRKPSNTSTKFSKGCSAARMADVTEQEQGFPEKTGRNRMKRESLTTIEREANSKYAYPEFDKKPAAL